MSIFAGSIEIQMLCWAVVLGLVQLLLATQLATRDQGMSYNLSARDMAPPPVGKVAARLVRAFHNFKETFVFFAVAVLVVTLSAHANTYSALGAKLYFWGRLAYVPVYALGIIGLRTAIWLVSVVGIVMVLLAALV